MRGVSHKAKVIAIAAVAMVAFSAEAQFTKAQRKRRESYVAMTNELASVKYENEVLKREIDVLRERIKYLEGKDGPKSPKLDPVPEISAKNELGIAQPVPQEGENPEKVEKALRYSKSADGTRHNSTCKFYTDSPKRACRPSEGSPCRLCGG